MTVKCESFCKQGKEEHEKEGKIRDGKRQCHYDDDDHCCHMDTAIKHPVPDWVKLSLVIFDIRAL